MGFRYDMIRALSELLWLSGFSLPPHTDSALQAGFSHCGILQSVVNALAYFLYLGRERRLCTSFQLRPHAHPDPITVAGTMPCDHWTVSKFLNQLLTITLRPIRALGRGWTQILWDPEASGEKWKPENQVLLGWRKKK